MSILETERLRLRELTAADAAFILELVNEPAWRRFIGDRGIRSLDGARDYLATGPVAMYARHGFGLWAVERKADGAIMGICGLIQRETLPDVDLGFAFLQRFWGGGYARESAAAVVAHGWTRIGLRRLVALTAPDNLRSIALLEQLGFRFDRMIRLTADGPESRRWVLAAPAGR